jgi:hypothetical protein
MNFAWQFCHGEKGCDFLQPFDLQAARSPAQRHPNLMPTRTAAGRGRLIERQPSADQLVKTLPPLAMQVLGAMVIQPRPLQAFCPLQALVAPLHWPLPRQVLTPAQ